MTSLVGWLREINPFNLNETVKMQEIKDKRIQRLEKVNVYVDQKVEVKKNYLREHTRELENTVRSALEGFDTFTGKDDEQSR